MTKMKIKGEGSCKLGADGMEEGEELACLTEFRGRLQVGSGRAEVRKGERLFQTVYSGFYLWLRRVKSETVCGS